MEDIDRLFDERREQFNKEFSEKHKKLIATTEVFRQTLEACKARGWNTHAALWNIGIYINIAAHDLSVLVLQLHVERDAWPRKQVARHVALTIYEVAEDMLQLLGGRIREPLSTLGLLPKFEADLRIARQPLDRFWKENQEKLKEIRIMSAAHRDLDGLALLGAIERIDILEIAQLGIALNKILMGIGNIVQTILNKSSEISPPELKSN